MIRCDDPPFVGYMPPKTGGRSLVQVLKSTFENIPDFEQPFHRHSSAPLVGDWEHRFHFVTIRRPLPRAVSMYRYLRRKVVTPWPEDGWRRRIHEVCNAISFEEFVTRPDTSRLLEPCLSWIKRMPRVDGVIRMWRFEEDVRALPFLPDDVEIPHGNRTGTGDDWKEMYTPRLEAAVYKRLMSDVTLCHIADDAEPLPALKGDFITRNR